MALALNCVSLALDGVFGQMALVFPLTNTSILSANQHSRFGW